MKQNLKGKPIFPDLPIVAVGLWWRKNTAKTKFRTKLPRLGENCRNSLKQNGGATTNSWAPIQKYVKTKNTDYISRVKNTHTRNEMTEKIFNRSTRPATENISFFRFRGRGDGKKFQQISKRANSFSRGLSESQGAPLAIPLRFNRNWW